MKGSPVFDACTYVGGGRISFQNAQILKRRMIAHYRLLYMETGEGTFIFGNQRVSVKPGNVYLLAPGPREARYAGTAPVAYEYLEFASPTSLVNSAYRECRVEEPFRSTLIHLIKSVIREMGPLRRQLLGSAIGLALHDTPDSALTDPRLRKLLQHLDEHPDRSPSIAEMAALAGLSAPQLRRVFKTHLGHSPKQHLLQSRMDYARRLLQAEGLRVKEVADLLGFPSAFQFSAQYHKIHKVSPSQDRTKTAQTATLQRDAVTAKQGLCRLLKRNGLYEG
jgi:AraC-like DNA-binding protein